PPSKLNTPLLPHPCSSSPMSVRPGSAESVVLPVPERPKKIAVSPSLPVLAEQCIAMTCGVSLEGRQIDDGQIGNKGRQILRRRTHQEIADEQRMPGVFGEDARL